MVKERRLHSISSAVQETGITAGLLERFLIEAGAISPDYTRPRGRKTFDAARFADLLEELPTLVGPIEMQKAMGATRKELEALAIDGVLLPGTQLSGVKSPWRIADGLALIDEMQSCAQAVAVEDHNFRLPNQKKA